MAIGPWAATATKTGNMVAIGANAARAITGANAAFVSECKGEYQKPMRVA